MATHPVRLDFDLGVHDKADCRADWAEGSETTFQPARSGHSPVYQGRKGLRRRRGEFGQGDADRGKGSIEGHIRLRWPVPLSQEPRPNACKHILESQAAVWSNRVYVASILRQLQSLKLSQARRHKASTLHGGRAGSDPQTRLAEIGSAQGSALDLPEGLSGRQSRVHWCADA